jgi:hypothetical protein
VGSPHKPCRGEAPISDIGSAFSEFSTKEFTVECFMELEKT